MRTALIATTRSRLPLVGAVRFFSASIRPAAQKLAMVNPATEQEEIFTQEADTLESLSRKFEAARQAQKEWGRPENFEKRESSLKKFLQLISEEANIKEGARRLTLDMGKPIKHSTGEVKATRARVQFFIDNARTVLQDEIVKSQGGSEERISKEPLGVVASIAPWNYPWFVSSNVYVPALLSGNAILYKPSEYALRTGEFQVKLLHEAGVPEEVIAPVYGAGEVGAELLKLPVKGVFFTGSVATGRKVNQAVASRVIKVQLELGGKDATYVCEDANVKDAAESLADGAMFNAGQSCCSVERIYVQKEVYDEFVAHFVSTVKGFKMGDPMDPETYLGPLSRGSQLAFLEGQVKDALAHGAKLLVGGKRASTPKGYYFEPTVIVDTNHSMSLMRDESFGPIIGIQKVSSEKEAVELVNDSDLGLTGGVYTKNSERAKRILAQYNTGTVYWNCCDRVIPTLPWSGRNLSGLGATLGLEGIRTFTVPKAWHWVEPK